MTDLERLLLEKKLLRAEAREGNFLSFVLATKPDYEVNWHHKYLARKIEKFVRREIKNLMVFMPPRLGKSELVSRRLPAFILGVKPDSKIIATSYGAELASMMNRDVQRIIDDKNYLKIFPHTTLSGDNVRSVAQGTWLRNSDIFEVVGHKGVYRSAGVGGGITGMGGDFIMIDDPIKNAKEADSETYRQMVWGWYRTTLFTRREKGCGMCLVMTRWHEDDLAGRLLAENPDDWEVVDFPMIRENMDNPEDPRELGGALWPNKYSLEECAIIKRTSGSRSWNALYQQNPSSTEGALIKRIWMTKFWKAMPSKFDKIIQSWDMSFKGGDDNDWVVGQVWGRRGAEKYLLDQVRFKGGYVETIAAVRALSAKHPKAIAKLIEAKANGQAVIDSLSKELTGIKAVNPDVSKIARVNAVSPEFEAGNIILPDPSIAPWIGDYIEELVSFPTAKNDDQVDGTTQALIEFRNNDNVLDKYRW